MVVLGLEHEESGPLDLDKACWVCVVFPSKIKQRIPKCTKTAINLPLYVIFDSQIKGSLCYWKETEHCFGRRLR